MFLEYSTNVLFAFNSQRKRYILTIPSCAFSFKGSYHKKSGSSRISDKSRLKSTFFAAYLA